MLYADRRFKVLVVLQGTDTSGKDGTIRGVFSKTSALGVRTAAWKAPSEEERAHDFLWRIHQKVPAAGEIVIFNRSHYEDVLVPVVKGWIKDEETTRRFAQINEFERMLVETGTVVLKFLLHISKDEQRQRLQDAARRPDQALEVRARRSRGAHAAGTPTRPPTATRSARPERRGRRGRSFRPTRRRTAT